SNRCGGGGGGAADREAAAMLLVAEDDDDDDDADDAADAAGGCGGGGRVNTRRAAPLPTVVVAVGLGCDGFIAGEAAFGLLRLIFRGPVPAAFGKTVR